jgi:hypothetical protein
MALGSPCQYNLTACLDRCGCRARRSALGPATTRRGQMERANVFFRDRPLWRASTAPDFGQKPGGLRVLLEPPRRLLLRLFAIRGVQIRPSMISSSTVEAYSCREPRSMPCSRKLRRLRRGQTRARPDRLQSSWATVDLSGLTVPFEASANVSDGSRV